MDFNTGTIIDGLPDRKKHFASQYLSSIYNFTLDAHNKSKLNNVKYIPIILYENYRNLAHIYFSKALVCADSFHIIEHLTEVFQLIRLECRRSTQDENTQYLLSKFKLIFHHGIYLNNTPKYNKCFKRCMNYRNMITILFDYFLDLKDAYILKERYINFNNTSSYNEARNRILYRLNKRYSKVMRGYPPCL